MEGPAGGLDAASGRGLLGLVRGLCDQRGLAVLWATHLCDEAALADRVVVLHHGRKLRDATPAALVAESGAADLEAAFLALTGGGREVSPPSSSPPPPPPPPSTG